MRRLVAVFAMLVILPFATAAGCGKNEVKASICDENGNNCTIIYYDAKAKKNFMVGVTKTMFEACKVDYQWPECGDGIHNGMRVTQLDNDPYRAPRGEEENENARTACVSSVSHPDVTITNSWFIGAMQLKVEPKATQGIFEKCKLAQPKQTAYLKAEHHAVPSTIMCNIWVYQAGQKWVLDFMITQALGDCTVQATIPAK